MSELSGKEVNKFAKRMLDKEFNLSEKIKNLFEVEYLDSMADVQGDVTLLLKEFIRLLKNFKISTDNDDFNFVQGMSYACNFMLKRIDKLAGEKLI
jgi:hypothetical protein